MQHRNNNPHTKRSARSWFVIAVIGLIGLFGCEEIFRRRIGGFAGSYPFVESWTIDAPEHEVLAAIDSLLVEGHPMRSSTMPRVPAVRDSGYWQILYFHYPDTYQRLRTWTRPGVDTNTTTIAFVGVQDYSLPANKRSRSINVDYWLWDHIAEINHFEDVVVEPIRRKTRELQDSHRY